MMKDNRDRLSKTSLRSEWNVLKRIWRAAGKYHFPMIVGMAIQLLLGVFPAWAIYVVQDSITVSSHDLMKLVTKENALYILLALTLYTLLKKVAGVIMAYASIGVERNIRETYLGKLITMPASYVWMHMDQRNAMGMTMETQMASALIPMAYRSFLRAPAALLSALVLMLVLSPKLVGVVVAMLVVITLLTVLLRKRLKQLSRKTYDTISMLYSYFNDWLLGYRLLKVYGCVNFLGDRLKGLFDNIARLSRKSVVMGSVQSFLIEFMTYVVAILFIVFVTGSGDVVTLGVVISFPAAIVLVRGEAMYILSGYQELANTESSISRLLEVLDHEEPSEKDAKWDKEIESVEVEDVTMKFDEADSPVLSDVSATFRRGVPNVLVGPSGAGKSTLINVMLGLLKPESGRVLYNGQDISKFDSASILGKTTMVEQEPFIFEGTLWDNVAIGRDLDRKKVEGLFREFALDYLIDSEGGLDLEVGTDHRILSLGERQRISLIRAIADDPDMLILDEVTSNIDLATSRIIVDRMSRLAKERLVICVSHDLVWRETDARFFMLRYAAEENESRQLTEYEFA